MQMVEYIKLKQQYWAKRKNIKLVPPSAKHKERTYTSKLEDNLFQPLSKKALGAFSLGGGNELGNGITPGKMQALHSSSAIAVNFFDYWTGQKDLSVLAQALKAPSPKVSNISFEQKYPISEKLKRYPPNLDVVLESTDSLV